MTLNTVLGDGQFFNILISKVTWYSEIYVESTCMFAFLLIWWSTGADPGFQVRGGALKKIAPSRGRRENFWGISCEKSRFYAKKSYFFQLPREARKFLRCFV